MRSSAPHCRPHAATPNGFYNVPCCGAAGFPSVAPDLCSASPCSLYQPSVVTKAQTPQPSRRHSRPISGSTTFASARSRRESSPVATPDPARGNGSRGGGFKIIGWTSACCGDTPSKHSGSGRAPAPVSKMADIATPLGRGSPVYNNQQNTRGATTKLGVSALPLQSPLRKVIDRPSEASGRAPAPASVPKSPPQVPTYPKRPAPLMCSWAQPTARQQSVPGGDSRPPLRYSCFCPTPERSQPSPLSKSHYPYSRQQLKLSGALPPSQTPTLNRSVISHPPGSGVQTKGNTNNNASCSTRSSAATTSEKRYERAATATTTGSGVSTLCATSEAVGTKTVGGGSNPPQNWVAAGEEGGLRYVFDRSRSLLGKGYTSSVYKGWDVIYREMVAIKVVPKVQQRLLASENYYRKLYGRLQELDHVNLMKIRMFSEDDSNFYVVSDISKGKDLVDFALSYKSGEIPLDLVKELTCQILMGLNHLHSNHILHRDIKLDNILFKDSEKTIATIIDFDMGLLLDVPEPPKKQKYPGEISIVGTKDYMAPESHRGVYTYASDIWSVGVLLFIFLDGHFPFTFKERTQHPLEVLKKGVHIKSWLCNKCPLGVDLMLTMLTFDVEKRCQTTLQALSHPWLSPISKSVITPTKSDSDRGPAPPPTTNRKKNGTNSNLFDTTQLIERQIIPTTKLAKLTTAVAGSASNFSLRWRY